LSTSFQLFNLETMSGVFPGTRTMVFQRVRVQPLEQDPIEHKDEALGTAQWVRLLWYEEPAACAVELGANLLRISQPLSGNFGGSLAEALAASGLRYMACGNCAFWQPAAAKTADGLPTGRCSWSAGVRRRFVGACSPPAGKPSASESAGEDACAPSMGGLAVQSLLALDCSHWEPAGSEKAEQAPAEEPVAVTPIAKRAERESDERWSWWGRLRRRLTGHAAPSDKAQPARQVSWQERIVERSGVGAGTEPCFACQGRIANLGALAVASPEGDKQTLSIWRCRQCFTYYLNDWIDRWERTDSLETEETYYRLAPQEALEILAVIDGVVDAEHPARRHERDAERVWMQQFIGVRPILSHQIKQGR
jgi:hypothetical protein